MITFLWLLLNQSYHTLYFYYGVYDHKSKIVIANDKVKISSWIVLREQTHTLVLL